MRSSKLFSILVITGGSLATSLPACTSSSPNPDPNIDSGTGGTDGGTGAKDTGTGGKIDTGVEDTGTGADGSHFW